MGKDCRVVRRAVYEYALQELKTLPEEERKVIAYLVATADCRGLRELRDFMKWESLKWQAEPRGKNPLEVLEEAEKAICSCYESPTAWSILAALAFLAGLALGYLIRLIQG